MAVLNKIRQRSIFLIIIIALALFSFIIGDIFQNLGSSSGNQATIATVNGEDIERDDFMAKVENIQRQSRGTLTNTQAMNRVWDNELRAKVMQSQYDALGISVERDHMRDLLKQNLTSFEEFKNEAGLFDEDKLNEFIANLKAIAPETTTLGGTPINYKSWTDFEQNVAVSGVQQTYFNLVKAGIIGTLTEGELDYQLENDKVDLKYVQIPYASIPDSLVEVKSSEIKAYMKRFPKQYEVEASRDLVYVEFKEEASLADEQAIQENLKALIEDRQEFNESSKANETVVGFKNTKDNAAFVNANSAQKFNDAYVFRSAFSSDQADNITALKADEIYGPYKENGFYKLSKMVSKKGIADSTKVRHILIPFAGGARAEATVTKTDAEAKATADSIYNVLQRNRSKFKSLLSLSSDKVSNEKDGVIEFAYTDGFAPEFKAYSFENPKGSLGVVRTDFGYHVIEILDQGKKQDAFKVATIAQEIEPSVETIDEVFKNKSKFEIAIADTDFETVAKDNNYDVRNVSSVKALDENIPGIGAQRAIVRWAFEDGVKEGDFKSFSTTAGGFVVVKLTGVNEKGLMSVQNGSVTALPEVRKEKKAALIKERISATFLGDIASAENQTIKTAAAVNMKNPTLSGAGHEPLVIGTAFGLQVGETSKPIEGNTGVFIVEVTKITPAVELSSYQAAANRVGQAKESVVNTQLYNALKDAAEIEDNRAVFY
ncbi:MAG: SurA N-terminal domain-containing protein [Bacteroidetes bacterium]|nr:SurA N-terminal domain-containing protein [Bacteroidota bacterium]MDA0860085.1 SurA N-terminal domain-containing protein [Bacteroidota bacterium]MDA1318182.1 SurA N-terminal domain-containing protein [Bacteroidota bacterium]